MAVQEKFTGVFPAMTIMAKFPGSVPPGWQSSI